jgi:hypothetical protein
VKQRLMWIAWPAFLVAGAVEMVVFAFVDPQQLHGLNGEPIELSRRAVYTLAFFAFWFAMMASSALTTLLARSPFEVNRCPWERSARPASCAAQAPGESGVR